MKNRVKKKKLSNKRRNRSWKKEHKKITELKLTASKTGNRFFVQWLRTLVLSLSLILCQPHSRLSLSLSFSNRFHRVASFESEPSRTKKTNKHKKEHGKRTIDWLFIACRFFFSIRVVVAVGSCVRACVCVCVCVFVLHFIRRVVAHLVRVAGPSFELNEAEPPGGGPEMAPADRLDFTRRRFRSAAPVADPSNRWHQVLPAFRCSPAPPSLFFFKWISPRFSGAVRLG